MEQFALLCAAQTYTFDLGHVCYIIQEKKSAIHTPFRPNKLLITYDAPSMGSLVTTVLPRRPIFKTKPLSTDFLS
jgi:hypothetical protein